MALKAALASHSRVLVLFTGSAGADGVSWCPDCNDAKPAIAAAVASAPATTALLEIPLQREGYKGNAAHWARTLPATKLRAIPTLMRWGKGAKVGELVEAECADAERVKELFDM